MTAKLSDVVDNITSQLKLADIDNAAMEAHWIIAHVLNIKSSEIVLSLSQEVKTHDSHNIKEIVTQRIQGKPLSRITGTQEFWGLSFGLSKDTLDPRIDSECLIDFVDKKLPKNCSETFLDLGVGSGCLALSIIHTRPKMTAIGVDRSLGAVNQARINAQKLGYGSQFHGICGDWFESIAGKYHLIVTNPPYIRRDVMANLDLNVQNHDPILALDGGIDGLDSIRQIIFGLKKHLFHDGVCFMEIGFDQSDEVRRLIEETGVFVSDVHLDTTGNPRVVEISYGDK